MIPVIPVILAVIPVILAVIPVSHRNHRNHSRITGWGTQILHLLEGDGVGGAETSAETGSPPPDLFAVHLFDCSHKQHD